MSKIVRIYTDGACSGNQYEENVGGWGAILEYGNAKKELHGGEKNTTNNRMELMAVIKSFAALKKEDLTIHVFTDSAYIADCFQKKWYVKWKKNGWLTSKKEPVLNVELWQQLLELVDKHNVTFYKVAGHLNLDHPATQTDKVYKKFTDRNGTDFTLKDFKHIVLMNNYADGLANLGIGENR